MIYAIVLMGNNIRVASHEFLFIDLFVTTHMHYYLLESENAAKCAVEFSLKKINCQLCKIKVYQNPMQIFLMCECTKDKIHFIWNNYYFHIYSTEIDNCSVCVTNKLLHCISFIHTVQKKKKINKLKTI